MGDGKEDIPSETKTTTFTITIKTPKEKIDFSVQADMQIKNVSYLICVNFVFILAFHSMVF